MLVITYIQWHVHLLVNSPLDVAHCLQWPGIQPAAAAPTFQALKVEVGVALEPQAEVSEKVGSNHVAREEFAKKVAMDFYNYVRSFDENAGF